MCRDSVKKAKAQLELNLEMDSKNGKMGFYRYVNQKRKVKDCVPSLMNKAGKLVTTDKKKAEVLNSFLPQSSLASSLPTPLKWMDCKMGAGEAKSLPM